MKKIIIFLSLSCFFVLTSCGDTITPDQTGDTKNQNTGTVQTQKDNTVTLEQIQARREVRKESILKDMKTEDKQIFLDLDKAIADNDKTKEIQIREEIQKLEDAKRKELEDFVKKGDDEKAKALRKEMRIFSEVR